MSDDTARGLAEIDLAGLRRVGIPAELIEIEVSVDTSVPAILRGGRKE